MSKSTVLGGETIRILRILRGWSQRELGAATGITPWRIFKLEKGICVPRVEEVQKIFEILGKKHTRKGGHR